MKLEIIENVENSKEIKVLTDVNGVEWITGKGVCQLMGFKDTNKPLKKYINGENKITIGDLERESVATLNDSVKVKETLVALANGDSKNYKRIVLINRNGLLELLSKSKVDEEMAEWLSYEVLKQRINLESCELQTFNNEKLSLILNVITDANGKHFYHGNAVARQMEYKDPSQAINDNVDSECKVKVSSFISSETLDMGVEQELSKFLNVPVNLIPNTVFINEEGFNALLFSSNMQLAKKFRKWVFRDVLPAIGKTGSYILGEELLSKEENEKLKIEIEKTVKRFEREKERRIEAEKGRLVERKGRLVEKKQKLALLVTLKKKDVELDTLSVNGSLEMSAFANRLSVHLKNIGKQIGRNKIYSFLRGDGNENLTEYIFPVYTTRGNLTTSHMVNPDENIIRGHEILIDAKAPSSSSSPLKVHVTHDGFEYLMLEVVEYFFPECLVEFKDEIGGMYPSI